MTIDKEHVLAMVGSRFDSDFVRNFIGRNKLSDVMNDPPARIYVGSETAGIDLLFENEILISMQISLVGDDERHSFKGALPFGIVPGMTREEIHSAVGSPLEFDEFDSKFSVFDGRIKMVVSYGDDQDAELIIFESMHF